MNQLIQEKDKALKCTKHKKKQIELIQVINTERENPNKSFFYCTSCILEDKSFDNSKYLQLDDIVDEGDKSVINRWPPINDYQIIEQLIDLCIREDDTVNIQRKIVDFFDKMRHDILCKLEIIQKKMINQSLENPLSKQKIVKQYQDISNIINLRQLILNQEGQSTEELQERYKQLVKEMELKKDQSTNNLESLLKLSQDLNINFQQAAQMRDEILSQIDQITFFDQNFYSSQYLQAKKSSCEQIVDQILTLVSNKTNFCSDTFLSSLRKQLQQANPDLLTSISHQIFQGNKSPIDFDRLNEEQLEQIRKYVHHSVKLTKDKNYENLIKDSAQIKNFISLITSGLYQFDNDQRLQLNQFFIEVFPFLKKLNLNSRNSSNSFINNQQLKPQQKDARASFKFW
ncbi:zinc carboxypeptidase family protein (macronuclear) [Tetrahymena thermophila SB210]|uniref:Zinc carboxypeptidase family protein n=1 Tax=Tetrahymena thermophila (strain SB210) TaxID=312017 RepID=Q23UC6_TETTS|nr:zinc carboxypeptidase family protein [Tetrahymena thermophila SB210]EAS00139.1 zinc carboxypeptidase family protein [Tetrahymena thermophila SB210]|eukprot:XP_001020384.1 zinc carboxypeptidase family protein [Tetrahymena thermophila SB210]